MAEFERKSKKSAKPTSRQKRRERKHTLRSGSKATKFKPESESESEPESEPESESESESGSEEEDGNKGEDDYKKYLALPLGSWESKVVVVEHISEPEDGDLVVYVKMYGNFVYKLLGNLAKTSLLWKSIRRGSSNG